VKRILLLLALLGVAGCWREAMKADLQQECEYRWVSLYALKDVKSTPILLPLSQVIRVHNDTLQTLARVVCRRG
jgi:hypothetical protein